MTEFSFPIRVYYEDTDVAGLVYHANYLKFFERARTEWLREMDVDQTAMMANDNIFAVSHIDIKYLKPARFNDQLRVVSQISNCGFASVMFQQQLYRIDNPDVMLSSASVKVVNITLSTMTPCALDEALKEELQRVI